MVSNYCVNDKTFLNNACDAFRAFDVELLSIANTFSIPTMEVSVNWTEMDGTIVS